MKELFVSPSQVDVTVSKPGAKSDVPVGVIVGSVIGGLVLLALAVAALWKVTLPFFPFSPSYITFIRFFHFYSYTFLCVWLVLLSLASLSVNTSSCREPKTPLKQKVYRTAEDKREPETDPTSV